MNGNQSSSLSSSSSIMAKESSPVVVENPSTAAAASTSATAGALTPNMMDTSCGDPNRKKSGFMITRIDKASISSAMENESDMENEFYNDRGGSGTGGNRSPGSSSVISENSSIFDDSVSPEKSIQSTTTISTNSALPRIALHGASPITGNSTPTSTTMVNFSTSPQSTNEPTPPAQAPSRPSAFVAPSGLKPLNSTNLAIVQDIETTVITTTTTTATGLSPSSAASSSKETSTSSTSTSRFHIIKIDTGPYKRGRWSCRDFDESSANANLRSDMIAVGGPRSGSSNCSSGKQSYYVVDENGRQTAAAIVMGAGTEQAPLVVTVVTAANTVVEQHHHPQSPSISPSSFAIADSQHPRAPSPLLADLPPPIVHQQTTTIMTTTTSHEAPPTNTVHQLNAAYGNGVLTPQPSVSPSPPPHPPETNQYSTTATAPAPMGVDLNNAAAAILDSIMVGRVHHGDQLLTSTTFTEGGGNRDGAASAAIGTLQSADGDGTTAVMVQSAGPVTAGGASVAIDNKIEQAMDLVKTHLLYAVREEVEVLKEKIVDLEKKVFRLETENKLLREYAPPEILQQIQQQHGQSSSATAASSSSSSSFLASSPMTPQQFVSPSGSLQAIIGPPAMAAIMPGMATTMAIGQSSSLTGGEGQGGAGIVDGGHHAETSSAVSREVSPANHHQSSS